MTAPTPEQMRVLAGHAVQTDDGHDYLVPARDLIKYNAALRAAADQLEAVQALGERWKREGVLSAYPNELSIALTAGTAPQED